MGGKTCSQISTACFEFGPKATGEVGVESVSHVRTAAKASGRFSIVAVHIMSQRFPFSLNNWPHQNTLDPFSSLPQSFCSNNSLSCLSGLELVTYTHIHLSTTSHYLPQHHRPRLHHARFHPYRRSRGHPRSRLPLRQRWKVDRAPRRPRHPRRFEAHVRRQGSQGPFDPLWQR
ncbi:hypothetical protein LZ30DRAFT_64542 [Colletotrichum cereale]|nr:hypothetical protein LZ30DRAFT_64542 [Colletotrichum cereale]